ncbi:hypothetical protein Tco_1121010 [Tanacetum coccineum]|uniref:Uncharacterized protein n=1 Tax=Tanacetum coccineum TaxID=301880 RepID=A0ABQ5IXZ8_9ASTR
MESMEKSGVSAKNGSKPFKSILKKTMYTPPGLSAAIGVGVGVGNVNVLSCLLKEELLEPALNLTVHCCGLEFRVLNGYDQKSFDEERGLNCC